MLLNRAVPALESTEAAPQRAGRRNPWLWVPTLYFAEGLPYSMVNVVSAAVFVTLGISNDRMAFFTSWLALPWVIKPLWSPVVDILKTRRWWIWGAQYVIAAGLAGVAAVLPLPHFFAYSLCCLALVALGSATHDIAADGFYMLALTEADQSFFSGIRSTCYKCAWLFGQGSLVWLAGWLANHVQSVSLAWTTVFAAVAIMFVGLGLYHRSILPLPVADLARPLPELKEFLVGFGATFAAFFRTPGLSRFLQFLLFYRFGEAQLVKMITPFLLNPRDAGGLGLKTEQFGWVYGTVGTVALMGGGIVAGWLVSRDGLRAWLWPLAIVMHVPDVVFVYLSYAQPHDLRVIAACVGAEQFGYGFGFTGYVLYMIYIARGEHRTAHYAICTGFMALGLMLPGMWSGWLQKELGYPHFFTWVLVATIPGFIVTAIIPLDREFGKSGRNADNG